MSKLSTDYKNLSTTKTLIMTNYQPNVQLFKVTDMDTNLVHYFLHAVTYCEHTGYVATGHADIPNQLVNDQWPIDLHIAVDLEITQLDIQTPVTHTISMGTIPGGIDEVDIQVNIWEVTRADNNEPKGTTVVSSTSASEKERPVSTY